MKKILCLAFTLGVFSSGTAYAVLSNSLNNQYESLQVREMVDTIGGGGGGGTTVYKKPVTELDTGGTTVTTGPVISDWGTTLNPGVTTPVIPQITEQVTSATVSSCPSGTTMSSDKCCCINN